LALNEIHANPVRQGQLSQKDCLLRGNQENSALTNFKTMKKIILSLICIGTAATVFAEATNQLADEKSRTSYAIGMNMGLGIKQNAIELDDALFLRGLKEAQTGQTALTETEMRTVLQEFQNGLRAKQMKRAAEAGVKNKADGDAFLAANKNNAGVKVLPVPVADGKTSDLQYLVLTNGSGAMPTASDTVSVNYRGTLIDGTEFDSSYKRGQPASFPVGGVIKGWTAALEKMSVGSRWKLFIPADLAYGEAGRPGIPPNSTLIFEVELLSTEAPAPAPAAAPSAPLTSDIIKVPSAEEMKKGAKIEVIKPEDAKKMQLQSK
jgi:FKBP-type peptidyl-prolyl cis-trans isomerase FklB